MSGGVAEFSLKEFVSGLFLDKAMRAFEKVPTGERQELLAPPQPHPHVPPQKPSRYTTFFIFVFLFFWVGSHSVSKVVAKGKMCRGNV
jgi:hypothetical protein